VASTTLWDTFALRVAQGASPLELAYRQILNTGELAPIIPWVDANGGLGHFYGMDDELPDSSPRLFDEENADDQGSTVTEAEYLRIYGKDVKTDTSKLAMAGRSAHDRAIEQNARALRMRIERDFVKGNNGLNKREMNGLEQKLPIGSSQAIANHSSGAGLSFGKLDELIDAVDGPNSEKKLILPKKLATKFGKAQRTVGVSGTVNFELNSIGRRSLFYNDVEVVRVDVDSRNTDILGYTEGSNSSTSVYCVAMGEGMTYGIHGLAMAADESTQFGLTVYDKGEMDNLPFFLTRVCYHAGMVVELKRSAARLYNITDADITG
jgi:hypothetical protein